MIWSNEALKEEDIWAAEIEGFLKGLAKESTDKLASLAVDEKGVLAESPKQEPFFDRNVAIRVLADTGLKLMRHTAKQFGDRAIKEALNAKPANE